MKAIGYIRVSTTNQDILRQSIKYKEFCNYKNFENVEEIVDFGVSGATFERDGFKKLQKVTNKEADIIVVSELSRLSRREDILDTLNSVQNITSKGLKLVFLDNPEKVYSGILDLQELITLTVTAYGAAQERLMIKRRNQEGKTTLFDNIPNAIVDGRVPYGFKKIINPNGNHPKYLLQINQKEAVNVTTIFNLILEGYSTSKVMHYLYENGIRNRVNKIFSKQYLSKLISNPIYKGDRIRKDKLVNIEAIIQPEVWDKVQILIKENYSYISNGTTMFNPLRGLIRCRCGKAMLVKNKGKGVLVYRCSETRPAFDESKCKFMDSVRFDLTNEVIFSLLRSIDFVEITGNYEERINQLRDQILVINDQISITKTEIENIRKNITVLEERYISAKVQSLADKIQDVIIENLDNIKSKERAIDKKIRNINLIKDQINSLIDVSKTENFDNLNIKDRAKIFKKYIQKIEFISITSLQGFYKIYFNFGIVQYVAAKKTTKSPKFAVLPNAFTLNEDYTINVLEGGNDVLNLSNYRNKKITIQEFFKKYANDYLDVNMSYRSKYTK